jgi:hypothetical protein
MGKWLTTPIKLQWEIRPTAKPSSKVSSFRAPAPAIRKEERFQHDRAVCCLRRGGCKRAGKRLKIRFIKNTTQNTLFSALFYNVQGVEDYGLAGGESAREVC